MITNPSPIKLTYEDYLHLTEDGRRHELIDGEHFVGPAPTPRHQTIGLRLLRRLDALVNERDLGRLFYAPVDVVLSEVDVVQPDLLFLSGDRLDLVHETHIHGAPDLVVEIVSDSSRKTDEITKRHLYERHGVEEYWIVDPLLESVKVYRRAEERFERRIELSREAGERLTSQLFPGLEISLEEIFE